MTLSSDANDILTYLKAFPPGRYVAMMAISRQAGGRQRFKDSPAWAQALMTPLVDAGLVEINERGHYRLKQPQHQGKRTTDAPRLPKKPRGKVVGDNYFPVPDCAGVVGDNYFPRSG